MVIINNKATLKGNDSNLKGQNHFALSLPLFDLSYNPSIYPQANPQRQITLLSKFKKCCAWVRFKQN